MASTTFTGDRRWTSTRKSGMTVLGKVPKPINLPSQRLENQGLDPNVEIVPKGTLTWGSRPSAVPNALSSSALLSPNTDGSSGILTRGSRTSPVPNAWGSSALLSPNTDGNSGSPSHVNARSSSSGSGTRPSTAGSDRSHELASSAWGSNSRPSSASGPLTSNQTAALVNRPRSADQMSTLVNRPQSAETRPGSAQLSRFAEAPVESTVARGTMRTAERGGATLLKANDFALTSGDFPSLSSDKTPDQQRGHSSHGRPGSSGSTVTQRQAPGPLSGGDRNAGAYDHRNNTWKTDSYPYGGTGSWSGDCSREQVQQQFDPVSSPDGVWLRGGAVNAPFRPAGPLGSYPIESYASHSQFRARQPISEPHPRPGSDPGGHSRKNVEAYPHHQPPQSHTILNDQAVRVRHGFEQSNVTYEGCYGTPHDSLRNPSEYEVSVTGISDHFGAYKHHAKKNSDHNQGILNVRPGVHASIMTKEQNEFKQAHEVRAGQYKVLLKQHDDVDGKSDSKGKQGQAIIVASPNLDRGISPGSVMHEEQHRERNNRKNEGTVVELVPGQESVPDRVHCITVSECYSTCPAVETTLGNSGKISDVSLLRKPNTATYLHQNLQQNTALRKNVSLIEKIEGLNSKARTVDGRSEMEEEKKYLKVMNQADHSVRSISTSALSNECAPTSDVVIAVSDSLGNRNKKSFIGENISSGSSDFLASPSGKLDSFIFDEKAQSQVHKRDHTMESSVDGPYKLRVEGADICIKKPPVSDILVVSTITNGDNDSTEHLLGFGGTGKVKEELHRTNSSEVPHATSTLGLLDHNAQRARLKEIAMRRAKELQKEEEERTREQKAKALAKLEELNRRMSAQSTQHKIADVLLVKDIQHNPEEGEGTKEQNVKAMKKMEEVDGPNSAHDLNQVNLDVSLSNTVNHKQVYGTSAAVTIDANITEAPASVPVKNSISVALANDSRIKLPVASSDCSLGISSQPQISVTDPSVSSNDISSDFGQEKITSEADCLTSSDHHDTDVIQWKQTGPRRRPIILKEENSNEKPIAAKIVEQKNLGQDTVTDKLPVCEEAVHLKKRSNRSSRSKNKLDETMKNSSIPSTVPAKGNTVRDSTETGDTQQITVVAEATPDSALNSSEAIPNQNSIEFSNQRQYQVTQKLHNTIDKDWKQHSSKKSTRTQKVIRPVDKLHGSEAFVWAPVRSSNRHEQSEAGQNTPDTGNYTSEKNGHEIQSGARIKRAEMERYVPKPIAKESSQLDNSQESSPLDLEASGSITRKPDSESKDLDPGSINGSVLGKPKFASESKSVEYNKPNRRGKMRTSWCQRIAVESSSAYNCSREGGVYDPANPLIEPSGPDKPSKPVRSPEKDSQYDECSSGNDNVVPNEPIAEPVVINDQGIPSKQQHQQYVVHKDGPSNYAPTDGDFQICSSDKNGIQSSILDLHEANQRNASRTKYPVTGNDRIKTLWKPKYQTYSSNLPHENRGDGGQEAASEDVRFRKEILSQDVDYCSFKSENTVPGTRASGALRRNEHLEANRVVDESSEQTHQSNQDQSTNVKVAHLNTGNKHDQQPDYSAPRGEGHNNSRSNRGKVAASRGWGRGQGGGQQILRMDVDRRKTNSFYQRTPFPNKVGDSQQNFVTGDEAQGGHHVPESKYRIRGQNHSRRCGHFHAQ